MRRIRRGAKLVLTLLVVSSLSLSQADACRWLGMGARHAINCAPAPCYPVYCYPTEIHYTVEPCYVGEVTYGEVISDCCATESSIVEGAADWAPTEERPVVEPSPADVVPSAPARTERPIWNRWRNPIRGTMEATYLGPNRKMTSSHLREISLRPKVAIWICSARKTRSQRRATHRCLRMKCPRAINPRTTWTYSAPSPMRLRRTPPPRRTCLTHSQSQNRLLLLRTHRQSPLTMQRRLTREGIWTISLGRTERLLPAPKRSKPSLWL